MTRQILRETKGATAVEFALGAPVFALLVIGMLQLGVAFAAQAGMRHGVDEAARYSTIYPTPTDSQITTRATQKMFAIDQARLTGPTIQRGTQNGVAYVTLSAQYRLTLSFVFFDIGPITLSYSRRAY